MNDISPKMWSTAGPNYCELKMG